MDVLISLVLSACDGSHCIPIATDLFNGIISHSHWQGETKNISSASSLCTFKSSRVSLDALQKVNIENCIVLRFSQFDIVEYEISLVVYYFVKGNGNA